MACFLILLLPKDYVYSIGVKIGSLPLQILLLQRGIHHRVHGEHRVFRVLCALCDLCGSKKKVQTSCWINYARFSNQSGSS
jgi:hypothetical protein